MYAIVKTGGKQYHVEEGRYLLVEKLPAAEGETVSLTPLLYVDGDTVLDGDQDVTVTAQILGHERGPKLRIVKFKPKRGYKRRTGHRQDLTKILVTEISAGASRSSAASSRPVAASPAPVAASAPPTTSASPEEAGNGS